MDITISLTQDAANAYSALYGWTADSGVDQTNFITSKLLDRIANDVQEQNNRAAIAAVPVMTDVTSDGAQTSLKTSIAEAQAVAQTAKLGAQQITKG